MNKVAAPGIATALAIALIGGVAGFGLTHPTADATQTPPPVMAPLDAAQVGQCRIRIAALPEANQPAPMECEHAAWIAQRWGGRVLEKTGEGYVERATYEGRNDFTGVPSNALPRPGYCRAWIADAGAAGEDTDCRTARRIADAADGRVLYMPL